MFQSSYSDHFFNHWTSWRYPGSLIGSLPFDDPPNIVLERHDVNLSQPVPQECSERPHIAEEFSVVRFAARFLHLPPPLAGTGCSWNSPDPALTRTSSLVLLLLARC